MTCVAWSANGPASPYQYILLVTAKDDKQDLVRGLEAGADDYLSKPFDRQELRARLRTGGRILTLQDEQLKARHALHLQATQDGLTGTWNRTAILDLLHREYEIAARSGTTIGVIMLDLDHFKQVNDTYGHLAGDVVLVEAARRMKEAVRSYDLDRTLRWRGIHGCFARTAMESIFKFPFRDSISHGSAASACLWRRDCFHRECGHSSSGPTAEYREKEAIAQPTLRCTAQKVAAEQPGSFASYSELSRIALEPSAAIQKSRVAFTGVVPTIRVAFSFEGQAD